TTLTAVFSGGAGFVDGVGPVTSGVAVTVTPSQTTTYVLTVTNAAGSQATSSATVTVLPAPVIASFTAASSELTAGAGTTLTAVFSGGAGEIDQGAGAVTRGAPIAMAPAGTTRYVLAVSNTAAGVVTA